MGQNARFDANTLARPRSRDTFTVTASTSANTFTEMDSRGLKLLSFFSEPATPGRAYEFFEPAPQDLGGSDDADTPRLLPIVLDPRHLAEPVASVTMTPALHPGHDTTEESWPARRQRISRRSRPA